MYRNKMPEIKVDVLADVKVKDVWFSNLDFTAKGALDSATIDAAIARDGLPYKNENGKMIIEGENGKIDVSELSAKGEMGRLEAELSTKLSEAQYKVFQDASNRSFEQGVYPTKEQAVKLEQSSNQEIQRAAEDPTNPMFHGEPDSIRAAINRGFKDLYEWAKETAKNNVGAATKYALIAGLSYEVLSKMAAANNGCWLVNKQTGEKVKKIGGESWADPAVCTCSGKVPPSLPPAGATDKACYDQCSIQGAGDPENQYRINWSACGTICGCSKYYASKPADQQLVLASPQYELQVIKQDIWGMLSNFVSTVGMYVERVTDSIIRVVESASDALAKFMNNIGWYIVGAVAVVIVIVIILAVVDASKKKQGNAGIFPTTRELKGGGPSEWSLLLFP